MRTNINKLQLTRRIYQVEDILSPKVSDYGSSCQREPWNAERILPGTEVTTSCDLRIHYHILSSGVDVGGNGGDKREILVTMSTTDAEGNGPLSLK
jgi:hypothetical protein